MGKETTVTIPPSYIVAVAVLGLCVGFIGGLALMMFVLQSTISGIEMVQGWVGSMQGGPITAIGSIVMAIAIVILLSRAKLAAVFVIFLFIGAVLSIIAYGGVA